MGLHARGAGRHHAASSSLRKRLKSRRKHVTIRRFEPAVPGTTAARNTVPRPQRAGFRFAGRRFDTAPLDVPSARPSGPVKSASEPNTASQVDFVRKELLLGILSCKDGVDQGDLHARIGDYKIRVSAGRRLCRNCDDFDPH